MNKYRTALVKRYKALGRPEVSFIMACETFPNDPLHDTILLKAVEAYERESKEEARPTPLLVCRIDENGDTYWVERK